MAGYVRRLASFVPESSRAEITADLEGVPASQASAIVLTDFLSVNTVFLKRLYALFYMEPATRRVIWCAVTDRPDAAWVTQLCSRNDS